MVAGGGGSDHEPVVTYLLNPKNSKVTPLYKVLHKNFALDDPSFDELL